MAALEMAQPDIDGVRLTWYSWPRTKVEASKCVIPIATCVSPIYPHPSIPTFPYSPLHCKTFSAILNSFVRVNFTALIWICPFFFQRNHFPYHYFSINESNLPAELYPQFTTVDYSLASQNGQNPIYLFVLDTCTTGEELEFAKREMRRAMQMLPENAFVGFVTFGMQVQVHELGFEDMSKVYVFRGTNGFTQEQVLEKKRWCIGLNV